MTMMTSSQRNLSGFQRWFSSLARQRAINFKPRQVVPVADLLDSHPRRRRADHDVARYLADVPDHLRSDLGLDGGMRMRSTSALGGSQMYYDRIIGSADRD